MKKIITLTLIISVVGFSFVGCSANANKTQSNSTTTEKQVESKEKSNGYSGTLKAIKESKVIPKAKGQILEDYFNIGDKVNEGDLLYKIDDNGLADTISTTKNSMARSDLSIATAQENLSNLKVYATTSGILHNFTLKTGERVNASKIAEVVDEQTLVAKVPFNESQLSKISIGDQASLTSAEYLATTHGTVTRIYDSRETTIGGSVLRNVEITADNPGGFKIGSAVSAVIETGSGNISSPASGKIENGDSTPIVSRGSGNVKNIYVKDGQSVSAGQLILDIDNSNVNSTLQRAYLDRNDLEIKLKSLEQDFTDLSIMSPASGKITAKSKNKSDNITSNSESIMTISDASSLVLDVDINEDEALKVKEGDYITVKVNDENSSNIQGKITSVSKTGKLTGGAKIYPVEITIDNKDDLIKPNTTASISIGGDN